MSLESQWVADKPKANRALDAAKVKNANRTVPIRVNGYTIVYVTEEQAKDKEYIAQMIKRYNDTSFRFCE